MRLLTKIFALCIIMCICVSCAPEPDVRVGEAEVEDIGVSISGQTIYIGKDIYGEGYTLYLPAFTDGIKWVLPCDVSVDGTLCRDGESAEGLLSRDGFTVLGTDVKVMRSANIPSLFINTADGTMEMVDASIDHSYAAYGGYALVSADGETVTGELAEIKGRGNSTWYGMEKKPYQLKFTEKISLLGLAEAKTYVLLANYLDPSLLRNSAAMSLAAAYDGYNVSGEMVDLYACSRYLGTYLLSEKIEIAENKIDIQDLEKLTETAAGAPLEGFPRGGDIASTEKGSAKWYDIPNEPSDITGGYILEIDYTARYAEEAAGFVTSRGMPVVIKSPRYPSRAQVEYIRDYVCDFEDALYSGDGYNSKGYHYSDYADMDSFVFRYLFEEFTLNIDGGVSSLYIFKDTEKKGGKLNFSVVWDYDAAFGNYNKFADLTSPEILFTASSETRDAGNMPSWFYAAMKQDEIKQAVREYYIEKFRPAAVKLPAMLEMEYERIRASSYMNAQLYMGCESRYNFTSGLSFDPDTATEELSYFIEKRIAFFDIQFK